MESVSLKLDETMLSNIDHTLKDNNYSTRTEFIRDAIRIKLDELKKAKLIEEFIKFKGKSSKKTTYDENKKTREDVFIDMAKQNGWDM
jgi:metal-responsive CopG/Arc/MetJ family transcriptional regulator